MKQKTYYSAMETMCLERAQIAEKERHYWVSEAAEWARLKNSSIPYLENASAQQLDLLDLEHAPNGSPG